MSINDNDILSISLGFNDGRAIENTWKKEFLKLLSKKLALKEILNFTEPSKKYGEDIFCSYSDRLVIHNVAISIEFTDLELARREFVFTIISELVNFIKKLFYRDAVNLNQVKFFLLKWGETSTIELFRSAVSPLVIPKIKGSIFEYPSSPSSDVKVFITELADLKTKTGPNIDLFIHIGKTNLYNIDMASMVCADKAEVVRKTFKKTLWVNLVWGTQKTAVKGGA
ncbi:MAG: hypothetical protein ACD_59C00052G0003 [uncultured bacterium]|nr:MAG: hypothetical protein ACD_59C00052G0003 [uncultured bacterium]